MRLRPSAFIIRNNKVLTLKYTYPQGTIYALPGGNLEFGEDLKTALQRELREEIRLEVKLGEITHIAEVIFEGENTIHFVFECLEFSGDAQLNPDETKAEEIIWLPLDAIEEYTLYPNIGSYLLDSPHQVFLGLIEQPRF